MTADKFKMNFKLKLLGQWKVKAFLSLQALTTVCLCSSVLSVGTVETPGITPHLFLTLTLSALALSVPKGSSAGLLLA